MLALAVPFMKSRNFEFLRARRPVLADLAGFAEQYAHSDPASSLIKQRGFVEQVVAAIYETYRLRPPTSDNLNDLMNADPFRQSVPEVVQAKLHAIRMSGNHAAHPRRPILADLALDRLRQLFEAAQWFHLQIDGRPRSECPAYVAPPPEPATNGKAKEAFDKLKQAEAQYEAVLAQLDDERKKRAAAEQVAEQSKDALGKLKAQGQSVAKALHFDETTTRRRLIDEMLVAAGWDVGANGVSTEQVGQEVQLSTMPTSSGDGFADYVLYGDDGKPLAVVEAKKTAKSAQLGCEQARIYATCLEKEKGRRPVIFFTNGIDIFLWDDAQNYPYRKVYGFYSKDSLEYLVHQRTHRQPIASVAPNLAIADRMYQLEAVKRVGERFSANLRRALVVQATGTGKTRVAVSLCDVLLRAGWAKRILFLCDRKELRRQADNVFKHFLPGEPRVVVSADTSSDRDKRIYLATYPAMMKCFASFDVGFFDLVIADESHRSIYKKYRELFLYFDALQVGLTATPVRFIDRDTFKLFGCETNDPTSNFGFEEAVNAVPPYLAPFRVRRFRSQFRENGVKYSQMSEAQKAELESQESSPETIEYEPGELDRDVFNKDTSRIVLRSLMEEGIREATGSHVGKSIIFARSHLHAVHLRELFDEMYPQYGGKFCRVIDNQEKYAEQLIDDFKDATSDLTIAISVDMLDTGIDVPEVVNLVFAKPVKSYVKFWQMIGRGTRLCRDLFGPGQHKTEFLIFDHWSNFWFFDEKYRETQPSQPKSLLQQLFEARVRLADAAIDATDDPTFQRTVDLLVQDIRELKDARCIDVRDRWKQLELLSDRGRIETWSAATRADLLQIAAPLMHWRNIRGEEDAYRFDLLMTRLEDALARRSGAFDDLRARVEAEVALLMKNQNPVKAKAATIQAVTGSGFWPTATVEQLETVRTELRGIMRYQQAPNPGSVGPRVIDVPDADVTAEDYVPKMTELELIEYKRRVRAVIDEHFATHPTLQRIRAGQSVRDEDLDALAKLVLTVDNRANLRHLVQPDTKQSLLDVLRGLVGRDPEEVRTAFERFTHAHPELSSQQLRFLQMLQQHIAQNGGVAIERLYDAPFTSVHADGPDGVFTSKTQLDELLALLAQFEIHTAPPSAPSPKSQRVS